MARAHSDFQRVVYDKFFDTDPIKDRKVLEQISHLVKKEKWRILDVGCANGQLLGELSEAHDLYGVDISRVLLAEARKRGIETCHVDLEKETLPFASDSFDLIICSEVIEHILSTDNVLCELNRILKSNRYLLLTFPNVNQPASLFAQIALDLPPMYSARYKSPHVRDYTIRIARNVLQIFGFRVISVKGTYIFPFKGRFSRWIANSFPRCADKVIMISSKVGKPRRTPGVIWDSRCI